MLSSPRVGQANSYRNVSWPQINTDETQIGRRVSANPVLENLCQSVFICGFFSVATLLALDAIRDSRIALRVIFRLRLAEMSP